MLGVILGILKIIGITLLVILLIIIALLLIVLFVPIRYKAHGTIEHCDLDDENLDFKEKIKADAGFTWLLHLVRGGIVQCTMNNVQWDGATIEVLDIYGKLLQTLKADSEITQINVSSLANGMYFVRMTTEQGTVTKRFVKK